MSNKRPGIAVIGGGSWATANIKLLTDNRTDKDVYWWMRNTCAIEHIRNYKHNPNYLSSVEIRLPEDHITSSIKQAIASSDMILLNVPAAFLKDALADITVQDLKGKKIISAIKGFIPNDHRIIAEYIHDHYSIPYHDIAVLSGPCHAEEVALEKLSYITIASENPDFAESFASLCRTRNIKAIVSDDIYGIEYAAALKNIFAVTSGICHGLGYGDNFQAVLISNAIREIKRFVDAVHPITRDIQESVYLGDLLVTAYSQFSRNRLFGNMIGKGYTVKSAQLEMKMVAEGYYATQSLHEINREYKVQMPISRTTYAILYEKHSPALEMRLLEEQLT